MINSRFPASHDSLNMGAKKNFNVIEALDKLFDGSEGIECPAIYRGQSYWIQFETAQIVDKVKEYFRLMPTARPAAFYLIGTMIHEDFNCSFLEKERNFSALKYFKLHDAIEQIYSHIFELLQTASNRSDTIDILKWGINLCFDLIHFNQRRMNVAKPSLQAETFKHTESGARLLQFLEKVFIFMLQTYPDESFYTLVIFSDTNRPVEERQFEWLMIFFL
uniref:Integrator complex subunit 5 N-terminal domain-containing protein n=1 Tax=Panagrolaimus superbus TaxID=310955 RepID=A0A914Y4I4_9BILA